MALSAQTLTSDLLSYTNSLHHSTSSTDLDVSRSVDILKILLDVPVTADALRETQAGKLVGKLSKHEKKEVADAAKAVLARWKSLVLPPSSTPTKPATKSPSPPVQSTKQADSSSERERDEKKSKKEKKKEKEVEKEKEKEKESARDQLEKERARAKEKDSRDQKSTTPSQSEAADDSIGEGEYQLGNTDDATRDRIQKLLYDAIGEMPADVVQEMERVKSLSEYVEAGNLNKDSQQEAQGSTDNADAADKDTTSSTAPSPSPSPSPPPIASLELSSPSTPSLPHFPTRAELAFKIEKAMFEQFNQNSASTNYKQKYRDLAFSFKDPSNPDLNANLYRSAITPEQLVKLTASELASESLKKKREKEALWAREAARSDNKMAAAMTDMFACERCGERKCTYFQMQTRGADEPMTVFVTCTVCHHKFKSGDNA